MLFIRRLSAAPPADSRFHHTATARDAADRLIALLEEQGRAPETLEELRGDLRALAMTTPAAADALYYGAWREAALEGGRLFGAVDDPEYAARLRPSVLAGMRGMLAPEIAAAERAYAPTMFGMATLRRYVAHDGVPLETPAHLFARVVLGMLDIHAPWPAEAGPDTPGAPGLAVRLYRLLARGSVAIATPAFASGGFRRQMLTSCVLMRCETGAELPRVEAPPMTPKTPYDVYAEGAHREAADVAAQRTLTPSAGLDGDSMRAISEVVATFMRGSSVGAGFGVRLDIRGQGSPIRGLGGTSKGLPGLLPVLEAARVYADQAGRRAGAIAVYLDPHHPDLIAALCARREFALPRGTERSRQYLGCAPDMFFGFMLTDVFFERVRAHRPWSFLRIEECPGLADAWGPVYTELYERYEAEGRVAFRYDDAADLWHDILDTLVQTGSPYLLHKCATNRHNMQANVGPVVMSNLCTEIVEASGGPEIANCNLACVDLAAFVRSGELRWAELRAAVADLLRAVYFGHFSNTYWSEACRRSNMRTHPVAIGPCGYHDMLCAIGMAWDDAGADAFGGRVFAHMHWAALDASCRLVEDGEALPYAAWEGSRYQQGVLHPDTYEDVVYPPELDWEGLRERVRTTGLATSLHIACQPTSSMSQILGTSVCVYPRVTNAFVRETLDDSYTVISDLLRRDLEAAGAWKGEATVRRLLASRGSIQAWRDVPARVRALHRTWAELPVGAYVRHNIARRPWVDQSVSNTLRIADDPSKPPLVDRLSSVLLAEVDADVKTLSYYVFVERMAGENLAASGGAAGGEFCTADCESCQ